VVVVSVHAKAPGKRGGEQVRVDAREGRIDTEDLRPHKQISAK